MAKIGRNDPCPCGSGKKYKKCCLMKEQTKSLTRSLLVRASDDLVPKLFEYAIEQNGESAMALAWLEFSGDEQPPDLENDPFAEMFLRWFLFYWIPDDVRDLDEKHDYQPGQGIASRYLAEKKGDLDSFSVKYLEAATRQPLSFWQVEAVEPGKGLFARDLLLNREQFIQDISSSKQLHRWDILLGSVMEVDGVCVFNVIAPFSLPARVATDISEQFNSEYSGDAQGELFHMGLDLIWYYQDLTERLFYSGGPKILNMDGKEIVFTKSRYHFDPADRDSILNSLSQVEGFDLDDSTTEKASFIWIEKPSQQSLFGTVTKGRIEVGDRFVETECNSAERDSRLRHKLTEVLGDSITHRTTSSEKLDAAMRRSGKDDSTLKEKAAPLDLDQLPEEARKQITAHLEKMHMDWADTEIPTLGNQTPRLAVKSPEGREQVIALIRDWENTQSKMKETQFSFDFNKLRESLGLAPE